MDSDDSVSSSSSSTDMEDVLTEVLGGADIVPYSFEPEYATDEEVAVDDEPPTEDSRINSPNIDWYFDK